MTSEKFTIRFDHRGNVLVDDPEVARRMMFALQHDGELVIRLREGSIDSPTMRIDPIPGGQQPIVRNMICPNVMCECGALKIVDEAAFVKRWNALGERRTGRGGTS